MLNSDCKLQPVVGAVVDTIVIPVKSVSGGRVLFSQELQYDTVFKWREPAGFQWTSSDGHREYAVMFRGHMAATDALYALSALFLCFCDLCVCCC